MPSCPPRSGDVPRVPTLLSPAVPLGLACTLPRSLLPVAPGSLSKGQTVTVWDVTLLFWQPHHRGADSHPSPRLWEVVGGKHRHLACFAGCFLPHCSPLGNAASTVPASTGVAPVASAVGARCQLGSAWALCCSQTPHPGWQHCGGAWQDAYKSPWCQLCSWVPAPPLPCCGVTPKDTEQTTTPRVLLLQRWGVPSAPVPAPPLTLHAELQLLGVGDHCARQLLWRLLAQPVVTTLLLGLAPQVGAPVHAGDVEDGNALQGRVAQV